MNKFLKRLALFFCSFSFMFSLSSCGFFNSSDEGLMIESITSEVLDDGSTEITINFTDEDMTPVTFTIPQGQQGEQGEQGLTGPIGVGIDHIETTTSEDGTTSTLTIYYTDPEKEPESFVINNGVSITNITSTIEPTDPENTTITIYLSDGSTKEVKVPNGKDGVTASVTYETADNGDLTITISYSDGRDDTVIQVPNHSGEDGRGIESITSSSDGEEYTLTINYTDGSEPDVFTFDLPQATQWYRGEGAPNRAIVARANDGDYYFDTENYIIYVFSENTGNFSELVNLSEITTSTAKYNVVFDATFNGGVMDPNFGSQYTVDSGYRFTSLPTPTKENATFIGWYTMSVPTSVDPNSGHFTTLSYVFSDLTLYACFEEN